MYKWENFTATLSDVAVKVIIQACGLKVMSLGCMSLW